MALIAPGAFLWLTFQEQALYGAPTAGCAMWFGIVGALALCFATAIAYAELSKLYPGAGSSYFFAEQAFLAKSKAFRFARVAKFIVGWASHLYYWVYPGCMVGVTAILSGFLLNQFWPDTFAPNYNSPLFMGIFCVVFALGVAYIAYRGVNGTTGVNLAINIIQITALLIFTVMAIGYRASHHEGMQALHLSNGTAINYQVLQVPQLDANNKPVQDTDADGKPKVDDKGKPVYKMQDGAISKDDLASTAVPLPATGFSEGDPMPDYEKTADGKPVLDKDGKIKPLPFTISYTKEGGAWTGSGTDKDPTTFNYHPSALSVIAPHGFNMLVVQACVAILILVGFESVTSMGEEARNAKRDIPRAVLLSLGIQGVVCYLVEYFAANYFLNNGYVMSQAGSSSAPLGDMMTIVGTWLFGSASAGRWFMLIQAFTVFLALIGTTLSCLNTGARVTYAMGRDAEVPSHFGMLHGKRLTPHRSIWTLAIISAVLGMVTVAVYLGGSTPGDLDPKYHNIWYSFGLFNSDKISHMPNTFLIITLISNFGTFLLYMMTCLVAVVAFREHHSFNGLKHFVIPIFGLLANLCCMVFYLVGPFSVPNMSWKEPYIALAFCAVWGIYGGIYFYVNSKKMGRSIMVDKGTLPAAS
jgi:amino acid transporter